jgi:hypothetical protein
MDHKVDMQWVEGQLKAMDNFVAGYKSCLNDLARELQVEKPNEPTVPASN